MTHFKARLLFTLFLGIAVFLLHFKSFKLMPAKTHAWAQSDHYALALGFLDNNFDFFHPQTYTLNHQFPPQKNNIDNSRITAVDFPLIQYVSALAMKILNTKEPWVFRLMSLLWSIVALLILFETILKIKGFWKALLITSLILFIPTYAFYQNSFMPSMAAFNSLIIGLSMLIIYFHKNQTKYFILGVFFMTLAALMRFTEVIFLIALFGSFFIKSLKNKTVAKEIYGVLFGLVLVGIYFLYNQYLGRTYGSVFLNKPLLASSLTDLFSDLIRQIYNYLRRVFNFLYLIVFILLYLLIKKKGFVKRWYVWELWVFISVIGVLAFNLLMSGHMKGHDYYALDTWIPLFLLSISYILLHINLDEEKYIPVFVIVVLSGIMTYTVEKQFNTYSSPTNKVEKVIEDFEQSASFLDKYIPENEKTVIISRHGWNTPMIGWQRPVYRVAWKFDKQIPTVFENDYDFIITHNAGFENTVLKYMPNFTQKATKIADNSLVSIWKPK